MPTSNKAYNRWKVSEHRRMRKKEAVLYLGGSCMRCGYSKSVAAMDFHHRDPDEKESAVGDLFCRSWDILKRELDKCDLLCSNCHREEHELLWERRLQLKKEKAHSDRVDLPQRGSALVSCLNCGSEFKVPFSRSESGKRGYYCTRECFKQNASKIEWPSDGVLASLVLSKPVSQVAKELGVSGAAIKKRCRSRGIQTPPRGYWSRYRPKKT